MRGWSLVYECYEPAREGHREALCALGNGYFVTRGAAPDCIADGVHYPGTYVAGGYNRLVSRIARRDVENEDLVNLPNWLVLRIRIDGGEWLSPDQVELVSYRQELDVRDGLLRRSLRFRDHEGRTTRWDERRLVSMADRHLAAVALKVTPEDWAGRLTVCAGIDGTVINDGVPRYRGLSSRNLETTATGEQGGCTIFLQTRFNQARVEIAEVVRTRIWLNDDPVSPARRTERTADLIAQEISLDVQGGDEVSVEKVPALYTSRDRATSEAGLAARHSAARAPRFDDLLADHRLVWRQLWEQCGIGLDTSFDHEVVTKLRVNIFHLLQTVSHHTIDLDVGVPARGWHGEAYRGHIFWDELFILPYLNFRLPALCRALLMYRVRRLPAARRAAQEAGYRGAMFPGRAAAAVARRASSCT
jgi:alpha,alpha-trehalase